MDRLWFHHSLSFKKPSLKLKFDHAKALFLQDYFTFMIERNN